MDNVELDMPPEREWITAYELSDLTGYDRYTLNKMVRDGVIASDCVKRVKKCSWLFHSSLIEKLRKRKEKYKAEQSGGPPSGAIMYDGFELTPDCIYRLEHIRNQNGYRAIHWTDKTVAELIAEAREKHETAD